QPVHLFQDMETADRKWGIRARYAYAHNTLLSYRTDLIFGSDAPVESPNPFWGMHAAVNRVNRNHGNGQEPWYPEECISLYEAIKGYTISPANQTGQESVLGSLAAGKMADLLVLGQDPFLIPPRELHTIKPDMVMVDGEWIIRTDQ
ncbi:MAG TPA: amidohydrolase family protein, partial [Anaerolineaceae bacterium]|nr:amidohydrolase family protein [Anaerolineaceae bacterium]